MRVIWAPWRMEYVGSMSSRGKGCIFCEALRAEDDPTHLVLARFRFSFVIMNRFPYNSGHLLVAPNRHVDDFLALEGDELLELMETTQRCMRALNQSYKPHGFNLGLNLGEVAGAGITEHLHLHIVPRWKADTNFMTTLSESRVIPQHLMESFEMLKPLISESQAQED